MHQPVRITRSLGVVPSVLRGFDVSGLHRTEAEYEDCIRDGAPKEADPEERFPEVGPIKVAFCEVFHARNQRHSDRSRRSSDELLDEEMPEEYRYLIGSSNFGQPIQLDARVRDLSMGDPEQQFTAMLDAHG